MTDVTAQISDALAMTALIYLPGAAWVWAFRPASRTEAATFALLAGLVAMLLPVLLLAEMGHLSAGALWTCATAVFATGALVGRLRCFRTTLPGAIFMAAGMALLLSIPHRGEWLAGGWDPGVNLNLGLFLGRTGTLHPAPDSAYGSLAPDARALFARPVGAFLEAFPGWPVNPETGAYQPYFYRGTPALIAAIDLAAGPKAAMRTSLLLGFWGLVLLFAMLRKGFGLRVALLGAFTAAIQPMLLHHLHIPASEILELFLICALGLLMAADPNKPNAILIAGVVGLAIVNRLSFLFFAPALLVFAALNGIGVSADDPRRWRTRAIGVAIALGGLWYAFVNPDALVKVSHLIPDLRLLIGGGFAAVLLAEMLSSRMRPLPARAIPILLLLLSLAWLTRESTRSAPFVEFAENAGAWVQYIGWPVLLLATVGWILWAWRTPAWNGWHAMLFLGLWAVLLHKHAAHLYPWALKRWLPFSIPILAFGAAGFVAFFADRFARRGMLAGGLLLLAAVLWRLPTARDAWRHTEFDGLCAALADVAAEIQPTDIVVADHFRWGLPLAATYGKPILNGEPLWTQANGAAMARAANALARLPGEGRRILLLTSTPRGPAVFPPPLNDARRLKGWPAIPLNEIQHHRSERGFLIRSTVKEFALYEWMPAP